MLAGAYASRNPKSLLTHSVEVDARGDELRVYCGRVAIENVADRRGGDVDERPTCPRCAKHFDTLHGGLREDPSSAAIEFVRRQPEPPGWSGDVVIGIPFDSRAVSYTFRGRREDLPLRAVPIDRLVATQPTVDKGAIIRLLSGELDGSPPILVLAVGDRLWIQDGHHRAYAAMLLGRETVEAYIRPPVTSSVREVRERDSSLYEEGIPTVIIAYHGTNSGPFTQFDPARRGSATDEGLLGAGFYASTDPQVGRSSKTTLEVSVRFERPLRVEFPSWSADKSRLVNDALGTHGLRGTAITVEAERQGYDGVVLDYSPVGYRHQEVVAFDRDQIQILGPIAVRPLVTEEVAEPDLSYLLAPRGRARAIGHEDGPEPPTDGIARYRSPHGSYRYVYYVDGVAVSALQVMTRDKRHGRVANVWTAPQARRHGYATALLQQARRDLKTVEHSDDLSTDAVAWVGRVGEPLDDGTDSWEDYLAPDEARYVPAIVLPQMPDIVARAAAGGMPRGAEYMGAGMTGVVFCVGEVAYKVARSSEPIATKDVRGRGRVAGRRRGASVRSLPTSRGSTGSTP